MKYHMLAASFAAIVLSSTVAIAADSNSSADVRWLVDASKLNGTDIYDFQGHKLGHLNEVLIDPTSGHIRYGVLEVDKLWSWSDPEIAVPWGSFAVKKGDGDEVKLSLDATKEKLEKAPKFKAGDANRLYDKQASEPIYTYWSIYWVDVPMPMEKKDTSGKTSTTSKTSKSDSSTKTPPATDKPAAKTDESAVK